jgi:hypothetical protein
VGDSLEVGTGPYLRGELAGRSVTIDAETGRPSADGLGVLRARLERSHAIVVFDLGTNDDPARPGALGGNLTAARQAAGGRCLVVATVERPPLNGVTDAGLNRVVRSFARGSPNVRLVDWHRAVSREPSLLSADRVHATPAGYALRARLVAAAVDDCAPVGAAPRPRNARPPRAEAEPGPPQARPGGILLGLLDVRGIAGTSPLVVLARGVASVVAEAERPIVDAVTPPAPEPVLGGR